MQSVQTNTLFREDTMLGIREAVGQDFGFNPIWLRIAFAVPVIWFPLASFGAYAALGVIVLLSRLLVPSKPWAWRRRKAVAAASAPEQAMAAPAAPMAIAA